MVTDSEDAMRKLIARYHLVYRLGMAFAFLKIFAIPSIARVLAETGSISGSPRERFRATADALMRLVATGVEGNEPVFERMRLAHSSPAITSDAMQYVLALLVTEPVAWLAAAVPSAVNDAFRQAHCDLWCEVGRRMQIPNLLSSFREYETWQAGYERKNRRFDPSNTPLVKPFLRDVLCPLVAAMGYVGDDALGFIRAACGHFLCEALRLDAFGEGPGSIADRGPKVIVITGCSSGFGFQVAKTCVEQGHVVFATMREAEGRNREIAATLVTQGCHVLDLDVTSSNSIKAAIGHVLGRHQRIDVVVNNAGILAFGPDEACTEEQTRMLFETNVFGVQRVIRAVLPTMRSQRSGLLVSISSVMAQLTLPFAGIYTASKKALEGLAESYRYQLAAFGIDSIVVEPGASATAIFKNAVLPGDGPRLAEFAELSDLSARILRGISKTAARQSGSSPQRVAETIANLVVLPFGQRPFRTCIDEQFCEGIERLLKAGEETQADLLASVGFRPVYPACRS